MALRLIGLIPWENFKQNHVYIFEKYICIKKVVVIRFRKMDTKDHCNKKCEPILLHCSKCSPENLVLKLWFVYILLKKLHVNVTKHLQSPLYLCLALSGCVKHSSKSPCGNYVLWDNTLTHYFKHTLSM